MRVVATGDPVFLRRYAPLLRALEVHVSSIEPIGSGNLAEWLPLRIFNRLTRGTRFHDRLLAPDPNPRAFVIRSKQTNRKLRGLDPPANVVLHIFCSSAPRLTEAGAPFLLYLDFTMAQARRSYPPWAAFSSQRAYTRWIRLESNTYRMARHIFVMGAAVKSSLVSDYSIPPEGVTVVGSGGNFDGVYTGPKRFGSRRILFDGSQFERKGGDILLEAFEAVRHVVPDATLIVVGTILNKPIDGVVNPGPIRDRDTLRELFLSADLVLAPTRCDPFPGFVIEAMNYGVPCIVSRVNGLSELIEQKRAGAVVGNDDPAEYARVICHLLTSQTMLEDMSENGRTIVRTQLNWSRVASEMAPFFPRG
jgi:glycogen(starch) synthase